MDRGKISMRQLLALLFAALLCPAVWELPARTGAGGGRGGWLSAVIALPVLLGLCWVVFRLFEGSKEGDGLAEIFMQVLGPGAGRAATGACLLWGMALLCTNLRLFGLRFLSTSYRNAPMPLFITALLALALWLAWKRPCVLARAGQVFYLALAVGLGVVLVLGGVQVEAKNVLPVWSGDIPGALRGAAAAGGVLGYAVFGGFLGGEVARREGDRRQAMRWAAALCLALTALQWVCLGNFGTGLAGRMEAPFFMMVKGIGIKGTFERVESVIIALWVFSDLALAALLLSACCRMAEVLFPLRSEKQRRGAALILGIVGLAGALWLFPDAFTLRKWVERRVLPGNLIFGFAVPGVALLVRELRTAVGRGKIQREE